MFHDVHDDHIILRIRLSPNASSCAIKGEHGDALKISVISVPEKGKANKELIDFLAKTLKLPKSDFKIISGELDRIKKVLIKTTDEEKIEKLNELSKKN